MKTPAHNKYEFNAGIIIVLVSSLSNICSLLTLYIIYKTQRWNAYVQIIISMTLCQMVYDISFYFLLSDTSAAFYLQEFTSYFMGTAVSMWTNVISSIVMYLVITRQSMDVTKYYKYFFIVCVVIPCLVALAFTLLTVAANKDVGEDAYVFIRVVSICYNVVAYLVISSKLKEISSSSTYRSTRTPLLVLSSRIKYYPLIQILSRAWPTYYELHYGFRTVHNKEFATKSQTDIVALYLDAFFLPIAGIGYFFVYLAMQPQAWKIFCEMFCCSTPTAGSAGIYSTRRTNDHTSGTSGMGDTIDDSSFRPTLIDQSDKDSTFSAGHLIMRSDQNRISNYDDMDEIELEDEISSTYSSQLPSTNYNSSTASNNRMPFILNGGLASTDISGVEHRQESKSDIPSVSNSSIDYRPKSGTITSTGNTSRSSRRDQHSRSNSHGVSSSKSSIVGIPRERALSPQRFDSEDITFL